MDWASRKVLAHRVAITLAASHAVEALEEAFARYGLPDIMIRAVSSLRARSPTPLSMDGKEAWRDNVFVERVWRSIKYEGVYLNAYESISHARRSIGEYIDLFNRKWPHSSMEDQTVDGGRNPRFSGGVIDWRHGARIKIEIANTADAGRASG